MSRGHNDALVRAATGADLGTIAVLGAAAIVRGHLVLELSGLTRRSLRRVRFGLARVRTPTTPRSVAIVARIARAHAVSHASSRAVVRAIRFTVVWNRWNRWNRCRPAWVTGARSATSDGQREQKRRREDNRREAPRAGGRRECRARRGLDSRMISHVRTIIAARRPCAGCRAWS